jgi:hypothetical protein
MAELRPGTYVRVYGSLKGFAGKIGINAFAVRAVHDFNEVGVGGRGSLGGACTARRRAPCVAAWRAPRQQGCSCPPAAASRVE